MKYSILGVAMTLGLTPGLVLAQQTAAQPGVAQTYEANRVNVDDRNAADDNVDRADNAVPRGLIRASQLMNVAVYNNEDEQVGTISDVVLDKNSGQVRYAALSTGGFLGLGDELHAIPFKSLKSTVRDGDEIFVLNVNAEQLEDAEGFNQDHWPNMADPTWQQKNDRQYGAYDRTGVQGDRNGLQQNRQNRRVPQQ